MGAVGRHIWASRIDILNIKFRELQGQSVPTPQVRKTTTAGTSLLKYIKVTTKKYIQFMFSIYQ